MESSRQWLRTDPERVGQRWEGQMRLSSAMEACGQAPLPTRGVSTRPRAWTDEHFCDERQKRQSARTVQESQPLRAEQEGRHWDDDTGSAVAARALKY
tara:strand:+ start:270 stop:563 length:294 start_codon:yes stop_codon:yes gene_type:complete